MCSGDGCELRAWIERQRSAAQSVHVREGDVQHTRELVNTLQAQFIATSAADMVHQRLACKLLLIESEGLLKKRTNSTLNPSGESPNRHPPERASLLLQRRSLLGYSRSLLALTHLAYLSWSTRQFR